MTPPIDITPGLPVPPPDPRVARRRLRLGLIAAAALAAVVTGGAGYAVLAGPARPSRPAVVLPEVSAPALPTARDLDLGEPGADPVRRRSRE